MKSTYEIKKITKLVGLLTKNEDGEYIVTIDKNDAYEEIPLVEVLDNLNGNVIQLTSEE